MLKAARRAGYQGYFFGGDAINSVTFATFAGGVANTSKTYSTTVGNPAASPKSFVNLEHKFYPGWKADQYDALAFDAANVVLSSIYTSKAAGHFKGSAFQKRSSVLRYIAKGTFHGTVGTFHFDKNGDIAPLKWISFDQLRGNTGVPVFAVLRKVNG
jgi:ABC-type branched-subunit amino acid transport system substrate-binding protein